MRALNGQVLRGQAVDGKDVRGVRAHGNPHFLVSLVRHGSAYVLGQAVVDEKTNEITAVPALLAGRDLQWHGHDHGRPAHPRGRGPPDPGAARALLDDRQEESAQLVSGHRGAVSDPARARPAR